MLKKLLSLCMVLALVASFSCDVFAQAAVPQGVRVRIISPDSGSFAGIDGSVKVNVLLTKVFTSALDTVIVALRGDTLAPTGVATLTIGSFSADSLGLLTGRFVDTIINNGSGYIAGSAVDTFRFTFTVQAAKTLKIGRPVAAFLPRRVTQVKIIEGSNLKPVITDNFIMLPALTELEAKKTYTIKFRAATLKRSRAAQ